jgi:HPt (histidine-containing phosphotransfer) domain-containing protein
MDGYVSKPVRFDELARVIAAVLPDAVPAGPAADPPRAPDPTPPPAASLLDRAAALQRLADDQDLLREIAGLFVEDCPRQLDDLGRALDRGDAAVAQRAAHTIKGSVGNFGAPAVVELAGRIEGHAKNGRLAEAGGLLPDLRNQLGLVTAELTVWAA